jgi:DNA-binding GntR family transcriptional regulator
MQHATKVHHPKLFETIADRLREAIIGGELRPGDKLLETELADDFGVSRGPIREALRELAREGLVVDLPRRGTVVSTATLMDLVEVYDVREALETFAAIQVIGKATAADLARLQSRFSVMTRAWHSRSIPHADRVSADLEFHREILQIAGNGRMLSLYSQLATQTAVLLRTAMDMNRSLELSPPDAVHQAMVDALVARDADAVRESVVNHYRHTRERLFTYIDDGAPADEPLQPRPAQAAALATNGAAAGARRSSRA